MVGRREVARVLTLRCVPSLCSSPSSSCWCCPSGAGPGEEVVVEVVVVVVGVEEDCRENQPVVLWLGSGDLDGWAGGWGVEVDAGKGEGEGRLPRSSSWKRARNFWTSGSSARSGGGAGVVVLVAASCWGRSAAGLGAGGVDQNQPIVKCKACGSFERGQCLSGKPGSQVGKSVE